MHSTNHIKSKDLRRKLSTIKIVLVFKKYDSENKKKLNPLNTFPYYIKHYYAK